MQQEISCRYFASVRLMMCHEWNRNLISRLMIFQYPAAKRVGLIRGPGAVPNISSLTFACLDL